MTHAIPFNRPCFVGNEQAYISQAVANGHISGDGLFTRKCQLFFEKELGVAKALLIRGEISAAGRTRLGCL